MASVGLRMSSAASQYNCCMLHAIIAFSLYSDRSFDLPSFLSYLWPSRAGYSE